MKTGFLLATSLGVAVSSLQKKSNLDLILLSEPLKCLSFRKLFTTLVHFLNLLLKISMNFKNKWNKIICELNTI